MFCTRIHLVQRVAAFQKIRVLQSYYSIECIAPQFRFNQIYILMVAISY